MRPSCRLLHDLTISLPFVICSFFFLPSISLDRFDLLSSSYGPHALALIYSVAKWEYYVHAPRMTTQQMMYMQVCNFTTQRHSTIMNCMHVLKAPPVLKSQCSDKINISGQNLGIMAIANFLLFIFLLYIVSSL